MLKRADDIAQRLCCNMSVSRCRAQLGMAEQHLDHPYIRIALQQMCRKAMAERVKRGRLLYSSHTLGRGEGPVQLTGGYRVNAALAGEQPTLWVRFTPIVPQQIQQ